MTSRFVRKRGKDSSGPNVSPFTSQSQPLSKRSTGRVPGRRLAFTPRDTLMIVEQSIMLRDFMTCEQIESVTVAVRSSMGTPNGTKLMNVWPEVITPVLK